jgi:hypothetical protein
MSYGRRLAITWVLALPLVTSPLTLAAHVHPAGIEGRDRALVHTHLMQFDTAAGIRAGNHGDHGRAIFPSTVFENTKKHPIGANSAHVVVAVNRAIFPPPYRTTAVVAERAHASPGPATATALDRSPPRI